jgi:hypothetical protein
VRRPGPVTFRATTSDAVGHFLLLFHPRAGITLETVMQELADSNSADPAVALPALQQLYRDVEFRGGLKVVAGIPVAFTVALEPGRYYLAESATKWVSGRPPLVIRSFDVEGEPNNARIPGVSAAVTMTETADGPRFAGSPSLPARGNVLVYNRAAQPHELILDKVRPGTTTGDLRAFFQQQEGATDPFLPDATVSGLLNLSPGNWAVLHLTAPAGAYAMLSFIKDQNTGRASTTHGMARAARLR